MKTLGLVLSLLLIVGCKPAAIESDPNKLAIETQSGATHHFEIELALSPLEIQKGLMHRTSLPENAGMLFVFQDEAPRSFWMRNTLIPLDMIFVRADGTIHHIHHEAKPLDLTGIPSQGPVMAVLEVNGGLSKKLGIQRGDRLIHAFFTQ